MNLFSRLSAVTALALLGAFAPSTHGQELQSILLPSPNVEGGKPLMQALRERQTVRDLSATPLPVQVLSDLLWAAFGVNRPDIAHRTAPSAMNSQEIEIYVAMREGLFLYNAAGHLLLPVLPADVRDKTSGQDFARQAPVTLIFVADYSRMIKARPEQKEVYAGIDTGYISQNVYLFCASERLGTVVHDLDRKPLAEAMKLRPDEKIVLAQAVGFPRTALRP